jgi:phage gp36-like protein
LYLSNRYNFNFEKANIILKNFKSEIAKNIYDKPKELENKVKYFENMIIELFDNVEITFEK